MNTMKKYSDMLVALRDAAYRTCNPFMAREVTEAIEAYVTILCPKAEEMVSKAGYGVGYAHYIAFTDALWQWADERQKEKEQELDAAFTSGDRRRYDMLLEENRALDALKDYAWSVSDSEED